MQQPIRLILVFLCSFGYLNLSAQSLPALVKANDTIAIKNQLNAGADPNSLDEDGDPLLLNAALYGSPRILELLLQNGANPNALNKDGESALMWAIHNIEKVRLLLQYGADVNARASSGNTPFLIAAVGSDQYSLLKLLLDNGADPLARNKRQETALMRAALFGDSTTLSMLVAAGNEISAMDTTGLTALINAIFNVNRPATLWLLNNGADPDKRAAFGLTAVTAVVTYNDLPSVTAVLQKAKDINTTDDSGINVLMWAAYNEHDNPAIIQALLDKGADVNNKAKNGETPLIWALRKGNTKTVALLKKAGAL